MAEARSEILQGTLDLMVLKTLDAIGPMHGYGVSHWIRQVTEDTFDIQEGVLYPALHRLEEKGWIAAEWGKSENNRRAKFYSLTRMGRKQLDEDDGSRKHRHSDLSGRHNQLHPVNTYTPRLNLLH